MRGIKIKGIRGSIKEPIIIKETPSGCWECISHSKDIDGYPRIRWDSKSNKMHRFFYFLYKGSIPAGMHVCHHCDNPSCVNPDHLFLGDNQQNTQDRHAKGRSAKGSMIASAMLTEIDVINILKSKKPQVELARHYGVSKACISRIKLRRTWKHVEVEI